MDNFQLTDAYSEGLARIIVFQSSSGCRQPTQYLFLASAPDLAGVSGESGVSRSVKRAFWAVRS